MGWLSATFAIIASVLLKGSGHPILFWSAVASAAVTLWTWGVMYNVAKRAATTRMQRIVDNMKAEGRAPDELARVIAAMGSLTPADANLAPNWATNLNMAGTLAAVVLLVWATILRFM